MPAHVCVRLSDSITISSTVGVSFLWTVQKCGRTDMEVLTEEWSACHRPSGLLQESAKAAVSPKEQAVLLLDGLKQPQVKQRVTHQQQIRLKRSQDIPSRKKERADLHGSNGSVPSILRYWRPTPLPQRYTQAPTATSSPRRSNFFSSSMQAV